jgi:hypothetical protein
MAATDPESQWGICMRTPFPDNWTDCYRLLYQPPILLNYGLPVTTQKFTIFQAENFESEFFKIFILKQNFGTTFKKNFKEKCFAKLGSFTSATEKTRELGDSRSEKKW